MWQKLSATVIWTGKSLIRWLIQMFYHDLTRALLTLTGIVFRWRQDADIATLGLADRPILSYREADEVVLVNNKVDFLQ